MGLTELVAARTHRPCGRLLIDNREVRGFRARIRFSYSAVVATCELTLMERPDWLDFGQRVEVWLGYDGALRQRFTGFVEDDGRRAWPHSKVIGCAGYMRHAERKAPSRVVYQNSSARTIIADLLTRAGVPYTVVEGDDTTLGTLADVVLERGDTYLSLIQQIDGPFLSKTYDCMPDGTVRRLTLTQLPAAAAKWAYTYPGNVLSIDNPLTVREVKNRVEVTGLDGVTAYRRADSPYVATGYDQVQTVNSDLIETADVAADVALLWMPTVNRLTRSITLRVAGNPTLDPGDTISLDAPSLGIDDELLYLAELDDDYSESGYYSQLTLVGGKGEAGSAIYPPRATFTIKATSERFDAGSGIEAFVTVFCDGSASSSPVGSDLTFAWSNNRTADVGTEALYSFRLTEAEWALGCTVTLTVTDAEGESDEVTQSVSTAIGGDPVVHTLYLAKGTDAEATPNSGENWYTSTIDAGSTPWFAGPDWSLFADGEKLYKTTDTLKTAPTLLHTFPSTVSHIWIHEVDKQKIAASLEAGRIYRSTDGGSSWSLYADRGGDCHWVAWAWDGAMWDCSGRYTRRNNSIVSGLTLPSGYWTRTLTLSQDYHYCSGHDSPSISGGTTATCKRSDGTTITFPIGYAPVRLLGLVHPPLYDTLYAADEQGRFYVKDAGSTAFRYVSTIGGGECYYLLAPPDVPQLVWAACNTGFYKSYDSGSTWYLMRSGSTRQAGLGSEPWGKVSPTTLYSQIGEGKAFTYHKGLGQVAPENWQGATFDDSSWWPPVAALSGNPPPLTGTYSLDATRDGAEVGECDLYRQTFTLSGLVTAARFQGRANGYLEVWINGVLIGEAKVYSEPFGNGFYNSLDVSVSPSLFRSGTNVLAVRNEEDWGGFQGVTFILEVS